MQEDNTQKDKIKELLRKVHMKDADNTASKF